jgi:hypothetical protein
VFGSEAVYALDAFQLFQNRLWWINAMESIGRLRLVLLNVIGGRGVQHGEQELFNELMVHKTDLLNLFDVGGRNQQEQRELETGPWQTFTYRSP